MQNRLAGNFRMLTLFMLVSAAVTAHGRGGDMQRLDDSALSEVSGQQGIDIQIEIDTQVELAIEDTDGLGRPGDTFAPDGAFVYVPTIALEGEVFAAIDSADIPGDDRRINVRVDIPRDIVIGDLELYVFGSGLSRDNPDYARLTNDQDNAFTRLRQATSNVDAQRPVITIGEIRVSPISLSLELNSDPGNLIYIDRAEIFQVSIGRMVIFDRSKGGSGGIAAEETLLTGIDLTGTRIFLQGDSLIIETGMSGGRAALTGLGLTNSFGETQNHFGNGLMRNIDARGTRISIGAP